MTAAPWTVIVLLGLVNVLLLLQNLQMRKHLDGHKPDASERHDKVPAFTAELLSGSTIDVNYTGKEPVRILIYFTAGCPYCHEQFPYWRQMVEKINANKFQVIGVVSNSEDRSKVKEYLQSVGCGSLPVAILPNDVQREYKLSMTPTTLQVNNDGAIKNAWVGSWDNETASSAGKALGIEFSLEPERKEAEVR